MSDDVEALAEVHVIDRSGMVWRVVRDGGMATRATYSGIISIGIATLEREHGPLTILAAHVAAARAEERERWAGELRALADRLDALYEISEGDRGYVLYNVVEEIRALLPENRETTP